MNLAKSSVLLFGKAIRVFLLPAIIIAGLSGFITAYAVTTNLTSQVVVGNAAPTVSSVILNHGNTITLTANATTSFDINYTISDNNGCSDITGSKTTSTAFRAGVASTCGRENPTASNLNCYVEVTHVTSTCASNSINVTDTVQLWYIAQGTDANSSYNTDEWDAYAVAADTSLASSSATSSYVELSTLTAINVTTSSLNYGTLSASSTTGGTNQTASTTNAGNSTTTLQLSALSTFTSGSNSIPTSSQRYSTSSFTMDGTSTALTASAVTVAGFQLTEPTTTGGFVSQLTYWGAEVPVGTPSGTYTGTNVFGSLVQP